MRAMLAARDSGNAVPKYPGAPYPGAADPAKAASSSAKPSASTTQPPAKPLPATQQHAKPPSAVDDLRELLNMDSPAGSQPGAQQSAVKPATGMMGFAALQSAANTVRKNIAQTTSQFMSTTTQGSNAPPPPDMRQSTELFAARGEESQFPRGLKGKQPVLRLCAAAVDVVDLYHRVCLRW